MSLIRFLCLAALLVRIPATAGITIEGNVALPDAKGGAKSPARYVNVNAAEVGPSPSPVAVVFLDGDFKNAATSTNAPAAQVIQHRFQFSPGILPVRRGTTVEFPNQDDAYHNVFSYSKTKRFDLGRYRKDEKPATVTFDKAGVVKLYCEIHEHMRGTILVLDTPYFVCTDTNGNFRLENLPAGKFTLKAWLDESSTLERTVELTNDVTLRVDFTSK